MGLRELVNVKGLANAWKVVRGGERERERKRERERERERENESRQA